MHDFWNDVHKLWPIDYYVYHHSKSGAHCEPALRVSRSISAQCVMMGNKHCVYIRTIPAVFNKCKRLAMKVYSTLYSYELTSLHASNKTSTAGKMCEWKWPINISVVKCTMLFFALRCVAYRMGHRIPFNCHVLDAIHM